MPLLGFPYLFPYILGTQTRFGKKADAGSAEIERRTGFSQDVSAQILVSNDF